MVEIFVRPDWVFPVIITLLTITLLITCTGIVLELLKKNRWTSHIFIAGAVLFMFTACIFGIASNGLFNDSRTVSNPIAVSEEHKGSATILPGEIKSIIIQEFDVDKVVLEENNGRTLFESLSNEDFVEFTALKDGKKMDGTVYFTEESMVVNLAVESDNVEITEIPTK